VNVWDEVLARLETKVSAHSFASWFRPTQFLALQGSTLRVGVPSAQHKDWLDRTYARAVSEALAELGRGELEVSFETASETPAPAPPEASESQPELPVAQLNGKYSFDTFVVGSSNQFAHAASRAVAELPGRSYNPLYLYGGVGLGKTHLMHAIGHYLRARNQHLKLAYVSSDVFTNEVVNAVRFSRLSAFAAKYRTLDVLLIDDVQFIAGKDRTQVEFFHVFNALHESQKQLVISSDCPPRQLKDIEERLQSRFEWGLIADIQPPDLETKVAILRKKADAEHVEIPENVALFIASKVRTNIRELEGCLVRLVAYASLHGQRIDLPLTQQVLKDLIDVDDRPMSIEMIQKFVADHYNLKLADLKAKNNSASVAFPRQVAIYLAKALTPASLPEIGKAFGGKHHSTVIHSVRKIEGMRRSDPDFDRLLNRLMHELQ
jgi:chromosomal replication initiator protein